ncbi:MAG: hypothetical protein ABW185_11390 [Sedimenticola sp.]
MDVRNVLFANKFAPTPEFQITVLNSYLNSCPLLWTVGCQAGTPSLFTGEEITLSAG